MFKKDIKVEDSRRAIELINNNDMVSECSFVLGMPDDTPEKIRRVVDLAVHYAPDRAFFLAIAPSPYSDIYDDLKDFVATDNYRRYNLVTPVLKPTAMTIADPTH